MRALFCFSGSMKPEEIIEHGLNDLAQRRAAYEKYERYFKGRHDLSYATNKFQNAFGSLFRAFADNLMPPVVHGIADNLQVAGFSTDEGDSKFAETARKIWQSNYMEQRAAELHREVLKSGDAYIIVWQDENLMPVLYANRAMQMTVGYDDESPGRILWALKVWRTQAKTRRVNLYLPDRVEKFESKPGAGAGNFQANGFKNIEIVPNPFGCVPVFHFANQADVGEFGQSELEQLIPLNDALNKMVLDMLVASEFGAFRQRWATGIDYPLDAKGAGISPFSAGASGVWTSADANAKFGDFGSTDLEQFVRVQESFRAEIARVASIPLHYLMLQSGSLLSGRALQTAERRFLGKMQGIQTSMGAQWAQVMRFALQMCSEADSETRLFTKWADITAVSELERLETLRIKRDWLPLEQVLKEAGYGSADVAKLVEEWKEENRNESGMKN
jgi:Phage portal protein, SPP1 Gp6-like